MNNDQRVKLENGKQKELIEKAKQKTQLSWKKLSQKLGICENYLKNELKKETRTLRAEIYSKIKELAEENYDCFIVEVLGKDWGRAKGGRNCIIRNPREPKLLLLQLSETLAEFIGIMLGDGNMCEISAKGIYQTRIFGHRENDYEYITKKVFGLFKLLFGIEPSVYIKHSSKVVILSKQSKNLNFTLKHFGLKPGDKVSNNTSIPSWVFENKNYLKACVRGLIDTDGCIYPKTKRHKTPSIWFSSASPNLRNDFNKALKLLCYKVSKWVFKKNRRSQDCSIGDSKEVLRYYQEIGFSNPRNIERFKRFWKAPIV